MNQLLSMMRRRQVGGAAPPPASRVIGLNTSDQGYPGTNTYYTNLLNRLSPDVHPTVGEFDLAWIDRKWRIVALPPGKGIYTSVYLQMNGHNRVKAGLHHILWDGGDDVTITFDSNMVASGPTKVAPGHWTFVMNQTDPSVLNHYLVYTRTNNTGANVAMPNEAIVHDDHLALWRSGSWDRNVLPDYLTFAGPNIGRIRTAKAGGAENSQVSDNLNAITDEEFVYYAPGGAVYGLPYVGGDPQTTGMPPGYAARLCAKLGQADLHLSVPLCGSDELWTEMARPIVAVTQFTGIVDGEVGNENWNEGYRGLNGKSAFGWLNSDYIAKYNAAPYFANLQNGREAEAHAQMRLRKCLIAAGLPPERVRLVYCSQYIDPRAYGPIDYTLNYVDVGNVMGLGPTARFRDGLSAFGAYMAAPYNTPMITGAPDVLFNVGYSQIDWRNITDAEIATLWQNGSDHIKASTAGIIAGIKAMAPGAVRLCYEWGHQLNGVAGGFGQSLPVSCSVADRTVIFNVGGVNSGGSINGDRWIIEYNDVDGASGTPDGLSGNRDCWFRQKTPGDFTTYYAYDSHEKSIATYASDADAKAAAMVWTISNNTAPFKFAPVDIITLCNSRMQDWLDGAGGAAMYQEFFESTIGADKWQQANQLCDLGYSPRLQPNGDTSAKAYGLLNDIYQTPTPRHDYYIGRTGFPA